MTNLRVKKQLSVEVNLPDATVVEVAVPRPRTNPPFAGSDFEGEKVNHLTEPEVGRLENMGGLAKFTFVDTATGTFIAANVFVERVFRRLDGDPFRNVEALFPSGAPTIEEERDQDVLPEDTGTNADRQTDDAALQNFLAKQVVNADEFYVFRFRNDSGGAIIGRLVADYDLGANAQDLGKESIL